MIAMPLLRLKIRKLKNYLKMQELDVDFIILKNSDTLKYMLSELYSPPPEEITVHRMAIDLRSDSIELYVSPLDFFRVKEVYGAEGVDVYAVLGSCTDIPLDMKCIEKSSTDNILRDKATRYRYVAVDDISICEDMVCIDIRRIVKNIRRSKYMEEVELIKKAISIAEHAINIVSSRIRQGISELMIASMLENVSRELGAEGFAFSTIVAVGENTAKPHHIPSLRVFKGREPILIDFGIRVSGYVSDVTRIIIPSSIDKEYRELLQLIENASAQAISAIKAGIRCSEVDKEARSVLRVKDLHIYFLHGVGHGLGVDVHEEPRMTQNSKDILIEGDTVTVEPGVYMYGKYGARLEDVIYVDKHGAKILTQGPRVIEI